MKKVYTKPMIDFENFSLSTSISSCDMQVSFSKGSCVIPDENGLGMDIFTLEMTACAVNPDNDQYNGFCYHVFDGNNMLFSS